MIRTPFYIYPTRHVRTVGKSTRQHQHSGILRQYEDMTYFLWANTWRDTLRTHFTSIGPDSILPVRESIGRHYQHTSLYPYNEITYNLSENTSRQNEHIILRVQRHHLLPVDKKRRGHEHAILHWCNEVTYILWAKTSSVHDSGSMQSDTYFLRVKTQVDT